MKEQPMTFPEIKTLGYGIQDQAQSHKRAM